MLPQGAKLSNIAFTGRGESPSVVTFAYGGLQYATGFTRFGTAFGLGSKVACAPMEVRGPFALMVDALTRAVGVVWVDPVDRTKRSIPVA